MNTCLTKRKDATPMLYGSRVRCVSLDFGFQPLDPRSVCAFLARLPNIQELKFELRFNDLHGDDCAAFVSDLLDTAPWLSSPQFKQARGTVHGAETLSEQAIMRLKLRVRRRVRVV